MTYIFALDLATTTGWARGPIDDNEPTVGWLTFGAPGASDNAVFAACLKWLSAQLEPQPRPYMVIIEAMLPPDAKIGQTTRATRDRLAGLHGIVRAVAHIRGIPKITTANVGDVRAHFIGTRRLKSAAAKAETFERCRELGWLARSHDAADACALWSYGRSLLDPKYAIVTSPLFNKNLRVRVQG